MSNCTEAIITRLLQQADATAASKEVLALATPTTMTTTMTNTTTKHSL